MKTNESSLTPAQREYILIHKDNKCLTELARDLQVSQWKVRNYLLISGLTCKPVKRTSNIRVEPVMEGDYFNVNLYGGEYTWLV